MFCGYVLWIVYGMSGPLDEFGDSPEERDKVNLHYGGVGDASNREKKMDSRNGSTSLD